MGSNHSQLISLRFKQKTVSQHFQSWFDGKGSTKEFKNWAFWILIGMGCLGEAGRKHSTKKQWDRISEIFNFDWIGMFGRSRPKRFNQKKQDWDNHVQCWFGRKDSTILNLNWAFWILIGFGCLGGSGWKDSTKKTIQWQNLGSSFSMLIRSKLISREHFEFLIIGTFNFDEIEMFESRSKRFNQRTIECNLRFWLDWSEHWTCSSLIGSTKHFQV